MMCNRHSLYIAAIAVALAVASPAAAKSKASPKLPSTPVESDAIIDRDISQQIIDAGAGLIRANGWKCDSVSAARPFLFSRGVSIVCNKFRYSYEIADRGGNWIAKIAD